MTVVHKEDKREVVFSTCILLNYFPPPMYVEACGAVEQSYMRDKE